MESEPDDRAQRQSATDRVAAACSPNTQVGLVLRCFISAQENGQKAGQGPGEGRAWQGADDLPSLGLGRGLGRVSELRAGRPLGLCLPGTGWGAEDPPTRMLEVLVHRV